MISLALAQSAELRAKFDHLRFQPSFPVYLGWGILYKRQETDKYDLCPCDSELKYKFCCWEQTKAFRKKLKE